MHFFSLPNVLLALLPIAAVSAQTSTVTISAPQSTSAQYTSDSDFESSIIKAHNFYRMEHNASALIWNDTSAKYATKWASPCDFKHSGGPTGENLAAGYANVSASVDAWGLERKKFNFKDPDFSEATGHFTQLVWKETESVGCARKECDGEGSPASPGWYVVCEYWPAGNVMGAFKANVQSQVNGTADDTVESGVERGAGVVVGVPWTIFLGGVAMCVGLMI